LPACEQLFTIVIVRSLDDDRTARARIRDEALALFAARGPDAVTVRMVAAVAQVSPALVIRHYGSKDGLRTAVDEHVLGVFDAILASVTEWSAEDRPSAGALAGLADAVAARLPPDSPVPRYLARLLVEDGPAAAALFTRLHARSRQALDHLVASGAAAPGADPDVRAAVLLCNDLAVLLLRPQLTAALHADPLSPRGLGRWGTELLAIYAGGLRYAGGPSNAPIADPPAPEAS